MLGMLRSAPGSMRGQMRCALSDVILALLVASAANGEGSTWRQRELPERPAIDV
jgi:hypothetical protein